MANPYYDPGADRAARVEALFQRVARRYDLVNDLQSLGCHRRWKRRLVRWVAVGPGCRALDVCCGTGDVALALALTGAGVVGLDFSAPMLDVARSRLEAARRRHPDRALHLEFIEGDALRLPFADGGFDAVTVSYGLRNLADPAAGLAELWRVVRPGGRLAVLDFGKPANRVWCYGYFSYLRWAVPLLGRAVCGSRAAYAYILESLDHYPAQEGVTRMLQDLGAPEVQLTEFLGGAMSIHGARKP
ncbi:MAG TPA: ubiquinone/menaquinone biosynthesis methyltransferase [Verrucomicrobiota bacterium]|nr:ubiquinone/menaquinone biosynthesis methyltransferase [Verrucomicrobiota bacterium]